MQQHDKTAFAKTLVGLSAIKPGQKLTQEAIEIYWLALQDWAIEDFKRAAAALAKSSEFMPNPYHFEQLRLAANDCTPDAAWEQLIHGHGHCDDPVGARALRSLGGWDVVGFADMQRLPWLKERFREAYEAFADSSDASAALPTIAPPASRKRLGAPQRFAALLAKISDPSREGPL